jgi:hypothetical protein
MIENRIVKTELIKWREIKPLQPDNLKHIFNYKYIEDSILTHGFSMPFFVWQNGNDIFAVDGHSRIEVLNNLENVPEQLPATFINAKDRKEAIEILLEVFNQKSNPIANEVLTEWVEIEQISVNVQSLNVKIEQIYETENEPDYSLLDDDDEELQRQTDQMTSGVKKAIQIEFEAEHYEDAYALVKFWREQNAYVGGMIMEYLKSEKEKI